MDLKVLDWNTQMIRDAVPVSPSVTRGFMAIVLFFLGLLVFELLSGEALGVPAKSEEQPMKYWIVLAVQAGTAILCVAILYFRTH